MGMQMGKQDRIRSSFSIAKSDCQRTTEGNIQIQDPSFLMVEEDQKLVCQCDSQLVGGSILPTPHYVDSSCPQLDFPTIPTVSCFPDSQVVSGSCAFFWCVCVCEMSMVCWVNPHELLLKIPLQVTSPARSASVAQTLTVLMV